MDVGKLNLTVMANLDKGHAVLCGVPSPACNYIIIIL